MDPGAGLDLLGEIVFVHGIALRGDPEGHADRTGNGKVPQTDPVLDNACPSGMSERTSLRLADRDEGDLGELSKDGLKHRKIESPV